MIETRLMQYFLAVAKEQNITKAAKVLHITQPTLSRQMAMLEKEIGATLFIKGSRPLSLTNEGYLLRRRAEEVLDLLAKTEAEVSCGKEELEGTVTIGCGEIAAVQYLAKIIEKFHEIPPWLFLISIRPMQIKFASGWMKDCRISGFYWNRQTSNSTNISACL